MTLPCATTISGAVSRGFLVRRSGVLLALVAGAVAAAAVLAAAALPRSQRARPAPLRDRVSR